MGLSIPTVEKFCLCLELKTGTIILGVLNLIGCIIGAIVTIAMIVGMAFLTDHVSGVLKDDQVNQMFQESGFGVAAQGAGIVVWITIIVLFLICVFYIVIASLLIHGARTGRHGLLAPWLVLTGISMVLQVLNVVLRLIAMEWGLAGSTIVGLVIQGYLFVCVWSFRNYLRGEAVPMPKA